MTHYNSPTAEEAVGYMRWHLEVLKNMGIYPKTMLDIGMAHGHFSDFFHTIFPDTKITGVECNERDHYFLKEKPYDVRFACLGEKCEEKTFYVAKNDEVGGGSSFYKEHTSAFLQPLEEKKQIQRLDDLFTEPFEFVKIDTQGSEYDIILGGKELLSKADFLLLELSFVEYNHNSPLIDEVLELTRSLGFRMIDTFGPVNGGHCWGNRKIQVDVLLTRKNMTQFYAN